MPSSSPLSHEELLQQLETTLKTNPTSEATKAHSMRELSNFLMKINQSTTLSQKV